MDRSFKLNVALRLPGMKEGDFLSEGKEATEAELEGLNVDALVSGGFLSEMPVALKCDACAESGTAKQKKERYESVQKLREHYAAEHPALAAPAE